MCRRNTKIRGDTSLLYVLPSSDVPDDHSWSSFKGRNHFHIEVRNAELWLRGLNLKGNVFCGTNIPSTTKIPSNVFEFYSQPSDWSKWLPPKLLEKYKCISNCKKNLFCRTLQDMSRFFFAFFKGCWCHLAKLQSCKHFCKNFFLWMGEKNLISNASKRL